MKVSLGDLAERICHVLHSVLNAVHRGRHRRENTLINTLNPLCVVIDCHLMQHHIRFHKTAKTVDARIEIVFDLIEIAEIDISNLLRDVALGDTIHIGGSHVQRFDDRIQRAVDAVDDLAEVAFMLGDVSASG